MLVETIGTMVSPAAAELRHPDWRREPPANDRLRQWAATHPATQEGSDHWTQLADWLIDYSTPEDRHRIMARWSWENGTAVPEWIISQPDTQPATLYTTVWKAQPERMVPALAEGKPLPNDTTAQYELLLGLSKRLSMRFYRPPFLLRCIAFEGHEPLVWEENARAKAEAEALIIPPAAYRAIPGRVLDIDTQPIGCPVQIETLARAA